MKGINLADIDYIFKKYLFKNQQSNKTQGCVFKPQQYHIDLQTQNPGLALTNFQG